jgi:RNA polymerase sigma-70 factor (ECF subfamily)
MVRWRLSSGPSSSPGTPGGLEERVLRAVLAARGGACSDETFRDLDAALRFRLLRYFRSSGFLPEDAEDLVQKTLERVFRGIGGLETEEKFLPWLFVIARNVARTALAERRRRGVSLPLEAAGEVPDGSSAGAGEDLERAERARAIWRAVESLPDRQRQCLPLLVRDGLSYAEIAATLRLSVNTVRNHIAAARKTLRGLLEEAEAGVEKDARRAGP